ncbi:hypothetical protein D1872_220970 [compost metagenome]
MQIPFQLWRLHFRIGRPIRLERDEIGRLHRFPFQLLSLLDKLLLAGNIPEVLPPVDFPLLAIRHHDPALRLRVRPGHRVRSVRMLLAVREIKLQFGERKPLFPGGSRFFIILRHAVLVRSFVHRPMSSIMTPLYHRSENLFAFLNAFLFSIIME